MKLHELYSGVLLEYRHDKTAAVFGEKILAKVDSFGLSKTLFLSNKLDFVDYNISRLRLIAKGARPPLSGGEVLHIDGGTVSPVSAEEAASMAGNYSAKVVSNVLGVVEDADPTDHKEYVQWLLKVWVNDASNTFLLEDINRGDLLKAHYMGKKKKLLAPEHSDINRFKTYREFEVVMEGYVDDIFAASEEVKKGESEVVYEDGDMRIIHPKDEDAACYYGRGTRWCTAATRGDNMFDRYNREGPLYIVLPKEPNYNGEKYQLHFESEQFMDEEDYRVTERKLLKRFPGLLDFFRKHDSSFAYRVAYAPDEVVMKLAEVVGEVIRDILYDYVGEMESDDEGYYDFVAGQYAGEDGEIDWDRAHEEYPYIDYNDDARKMVYAAGRVVEIPLKHIKAYALDMEEDRGEPTVFNDMDTLYRIMLRDEYDVPSYYVDGMYNQIYVGKHPNGDRVIKPVHEVDVGVGVLYVCRLKEK